MEEEQERPVHNGDQQESAVREQTNFDQITPVNKQLDKAMDAWATTGKCDAVPVRESYHGTQWYHAQRKKI